MKEFIKRMQNKTPEEKQIFSIAIALVLTSLIATIWFVSIQVTDRSSVYTSAEQNQANPLSAFFGLVGSAVTATSTVYFGE